MVGIVVPSLRSSSGAELIDDISPSNRPSGTICQQSGSTTASCQGSWTVAGSAQGEGSATATNGFTQLSGYASTTLTASQIVGGGLITQSVAVTNSADTLSFSGLSAGAFLRAQVFSTGNVTGDTNQGSTVDAFVELNDAVHSCSINAFKGRCSTTIPIAPTDLVSLAAGLSVSANSSLANVAGSSGVILDFATSGRGARIVLVIVDAKGHPVKGASVVAASTTIYPTR